MVVYGQLTIVLDPLGFVVGADSGESITFGCENR